ncbi:MAG: aldo/keto reductase [Spirochaetes bacterium]|nr:MAG: aldo/keto reductase [Spirochaetota bacterium]
MKYELLGNSGLRVSELCLGTMTFGSDWGWGAAREECKKMFDAFVKENGNFIDTANHYTNGTSEKLVGEFIAGERAHFVIGTKYTLNGSPADPNGGGNHRKSMVQSLDASLKRLNTDYIDIYWVHAYDGLTPVEEVMRALDDQVRAGKILYAGISDAPAWLIAQANTIASLRGWSPFIAIQVQYNLVERTPERDLLPMARALGIGITSWSPLAMGVLTGKYNRNDGAPRRFSKSDAMAAVYVNERNLAIAKGVADIASEAGRTPSHVAINWIRQKNAYGVPLPIIAGRTEAQLKDNMACLDFTLTPAQMDRLDALSAITLGFPHDFLGSPGVRELIHGKTEPLINPRR